MTIGGWICFCCQTVSDWLHCSGFSPILCEGSDFSTSSLILIFFLFFFKQFDYQFIKKVVTGISSGDFHLDFWLSADGSDLLDNFRRTVQVNESLVDPHLESIPSLRTFTVSSFPRSYSQRLGRHLNRSFHLEILFLRASDQVSTHLLQRLHSAAGEGDPNPVNGHLWLHGSLAGIFKGPGCGVAS